MGRLLIRRLYYGPPEWVVTHWSAKDRRAFAFWSLWVSVVLSYWFADYTRWVTVLSLLALVSTFTSETPVEQEGSGDI